VNTWTFIWLMLFLKIPIIALLLLVRWAVKQTPDAAGADDWRIGPVAGPLHPHHPRTRPPQRPRRGPHGGLPTPAPSRVRAVAPSRLLPLH